MGKKTTWALTPSVFIDASVWIAGICKETGGSNLLLRFGTARKIMPVVSDAVLAEVARKLHLMDSALFKRYQQIVEAMSVRRVPSPSEAELTRWNEVTANKDRHVLAAAVEAGVDVIVSLDRRHLLTTTVAKHCPIPVMSTADFWHWLRTGTR